MSSAQSSDRTGSPSRSNDSQSRSSNFDAAMQLASSNLQQRTDSSSQGIDGFSSCCCYSNFCVLVIGCLSNEHEFAVCMQISVWPAGLDHDIGL